jgi:hypothetical protein
VPVDWGQQIFASADLGTSTVSRAPDSSGSGSQAMQLTLHNPARGYVVDSPSVHYDGTQESTALDPLPPVAYENRYGSGRATEAMRFAGWYYLSVSLNPEIAEGFGKAALPLTLRVNIEGRATEGPAYARPAGDFEVTQDDREAAASGKSAPEAAKSDTMELIAVAGIGAGTVLVLGLGVWTLVARRRAAAAAVAVMPGPGQYGPPSPR